MRASDTMRGPIMHYNGQDGELQDDGRDIVVIGNPNSAENKSGNFLESIIGVDFDANWTNGRIALSIVSERETGVSVSVSYGRSGTHVRGNARYGRTSIAG